MNNTDKLLRAFIEALGYEIEELVDRKETPISKQIGESGIASCFNHGKTNDLVISGDGSYKRGEDECYYLKPSLNVDYKVTKLNRDKPTLHKLVRMYETKDMQLGELLARITEHEEANQ